MVRHRSGDPPFVDIMQFRRNTNRAAHLFRRLIGECIDLRIALMCGLKPVKVDESQLEQVVVNLIVNARDAMGGKNTIQVKTYNVAANEPRRQRNKVMLARKFVLLGLMIPGPALPKIWTECSSSFSGPEMSAWVPACGCIRYTV